MECFSQVLSILSTGKVDNRDVCPFFTVVSVSDVCLEAFPGRVWVCQLSSWAC